MNYTVVTTFNANGYNLYASKMIDTFLKHWPESVTLKVYAEDCDVKQNANNLEIVDLKIASPELVKFKTRWQGVPNANGDVSDDPIRNKRRDAGKGFKWDAVRFAHKVYAIFAAAKDPSTDCLIWMDADSVCHSPITKSVIDDLCGSGTDLGFLGREKKYTECGLYSMNLRSTAIQNFLIEFQRMYDDAENGIFTLEEWHDSFVFDVVRNKFKGQIKENNWSQGIITGEGHPLINSKWGAYLDHLKGDRKDLGRSKNKDLKIVRTENYWQI